MSKDILDWHDCPHQKTAHMLGPEHIGQYYVECEAIDRVVKTKDFGWCAEGSNRATHIFFCPFCGKRLV